MADSKKKTTKELEAIVEKESAEAVKAEKKALKEEKELKAAKEALAKRIAADAGTPVNKDKTPGVDQEALQAAWSRHCIRFGYNRSKPIPADFKIPN